jgi:chromosome segregation ATPase
MVRRDKLVARKANDGGVLVGVPTVNDGRETADDQSTDGRETVAELTAEVLDLRVANARLEARVEAVAKLEAQLVEVSAKLEARDETLTELREKLAETRAQVDAARTVAVAEVATAKAETAAAIRHIELLDALLVEARRPWWRRLLG